MKNQKREYVTGTLQSVCLGVVLFFGIGSPTDSFLPVSHAAPLEVQASKAKGAKDRRIRTDEEREVRRQNRLYKKQASQLERQYRSRSRSAENTAERDAMLAIAQYWKDQSARAR